MPRMARLGLPGMPMHVVQRGHNRQECFRADADCQFYLAQLEDLAAEFGCAVHAYVLMTNHAHILMTPETSDGLSAMMKRLAQRHAQRFNRRYDRTGTLWEGRYRSSIVESDTYLLACYRYIEMNPVRAGIVTAPQIYPYSSAQQHLTGIFPEKTPLDRAFWHDFGGSPAWAELLAAGNLTEEESYQLRHCTYGGRPFAAAVFIEDIETRFGRHWCRSHRRQRR